MRPVPVPDNLREAEWVIGTAVFSAPNGDLTSEAVPPAEGLFFNSSVSGFGDSVIPMVGVLLYLEEDEVEAINQGARHLLMSWPGRRMPVFIVPEVISLEDV